MKRVTSTFAAGARVYPAGVLLPDNHPEVKAKGRGHLFEDVPRTAAEPEQEPDQVTPPVPNPDQTPEPEKPKRSRKTTTKSSDTQPPAPDGDQGEKPADSDGQEQDNGDAGADGAT